VAAAIIAALVLAGGAFAVARAGVLDGGVDAVAAPGKAVRAAITGFHRAEDRRLRDALSTPKVLGVPRARLNAIASCESGGDPSAVSSDGSYRGKYQFHRGTWASVGSPGDPIRASEPEQDRRAALLIKRSGGSSPWPICG
jgi:soluble lytic murein transglycosylase-like protein